MTRLYEVNFFVKLAAAMLLMASGWLLPVVPSAVLALLTLAGLAVLRVPRLKGYLRGTALLVAMVLVTWIVNLWFQGHPPMEALPIAARMAARLVTTTAAFFFVMETSTPGSILAAASAARLPPMATLVLSLLFGIIPMLREEFHAIADAQRARGMEIDGVPLHTRLRYALARGIPLLVHGIRMAHAISTSLALSGFDARIKRSTWRQVGLMVEPKLKTGAAST